MSIVVSPSRDRLVERRESILSRLNVTSEEFEAAKSARSLTGDEWEAKENLEAIEFLLGDNPSE